MLFRSFDIAALQYLYDAANVTSGTTYSWNADQRFFQTIWDPSGLSSIDLSNQTKANIVDLRAGKQSSIAMRGAYDDMPFTQSEYGALTTTVNGKSVKISSLIGRPTYTGSNNLTIAAGSRVNQVIGGSGTDTIITNAEQNTVETGNGDDKVYLSGTAAGIDGTTIDGGQGSDTLYVRKLAGHSWSFSGATLTLTKAATNTQSAQQIEIGRAHV